MESAARLVPTVIKRNAQSSLKNARSLRITESFAKKTDDETNFYVFNLAPTGFVIISAEDRYNPVLAFSEESQLILENEAEYIGLWGTLSHHEERINYIRENNLQPSWTVQREWQGLRNGDTALSRSSGVVIPPLTTTKWNQGTYYNAECPANEDTAANGPDGRTYCGCGPVAMAQLIKYHDAPVNGNGSNSYVDPVYGIQSADFCNTTYNWDNMPDELTAPNADVAKLIYHAGVATYTYYSTDYTETYISYMRDAFVNYFGFDQSANWFYDANGDFHWVAKNDLDRGRPLLLSGVSIYGGAHTWVADGYGYFSADDSEGSDEYFHYNWGWGGSNNGWFLNTDESWFPRADDTTNVEITYYFDRYVVQNLFPAEGCQPPERTYTSGAENSSIYLNVQYYSGEQDISFRYRKMGTDEWTTTEATNDYFQLINNLETASEYEYQARRKCCPNDWSPYSESQTFTTAGFVPCTPLAASGMSVSSITDNNGYVYTVQPFGAVLNKFRYRPVGTDTWITTHESTLYYRYLSDLQAGTTYEVQVTQQCSNGAFASYSDSFTFMTTGTAAPDSGETETDTDCPAVDGTSITTSSISDNNAYVYTPQPFGATLNQFRYRPENADNWITTDESTLYYRYLSNLRAGTTYEVQVRQQCSDGSYSKFSNSFSFMTTGTSSGMMDDDDGETDEVEVVTSSDCQPVLAEQLTTSSTTQNNSYVYTPQPLGATNNQFRYRPIGAADWATTDISTLYYRYLSSLMAGMTYEFQVRQECSTNSWSKFSESGFFTTTGDSGMRIVNTSKSSTPLSLQEVSEMTNFSRPIMGLFPNPATSQVALFTEANFYDNDQVNVIDRLGRNVKTLRLNGQQKELRLDISDLEAGLYWVQWQSQKGSQALKLVKN